MRPQGFGVARDNLGELSPLPIESDSSDLQAPHRGSVAVRCDLPAKVITLMGWRALTLRRYAISFAAVRAWSRPLKAGQDQVSV